MLKRLELENFRSYEKIGVDCDSDLVLILGDNAAGKTNLLEAVYYLLTLRSFRSPDALLAKTDTGYFQISGEFSDSVNAQVVVQVTPSLRRKCRLNGQSRVRSEWLFNPVVLFVPSDLNLFFLNPSERRRFLNQVLSQTKPGYESDIAELNRILKQKTALLALIQQGGASSAELDLWNEQLARVSVGVTAARQELVDYLEASFNSMYQQLFGTSRHFSFDYKRIKFSDFDQLLSYLNEHKSAEIASGTNLIGPHRDDLSLVADGTNTIHNSSQGEMRSQILTLKFLESNFLEQKTGKNPTVLLDDVFSELDEIRRGRLMQFFSNNQVFITTTEEHHLPGFNRSCKIIRLNQSNLD